MLITNSQKGAYGSSPHQHITQPMETLLTKYTRIVLLDFLYTYNFNLLIHIILFALLATVFHVATYSVILVTLLV